MGDWTDRRKALFLHIEPRWAWGSRLTNPPPPTSKAPSFIADNTTSTSQRPCANSAKPGDGRGKGGIEQDLWEMCEDGVSLYGASCHLLSPAPPLAGPGHRNMQHALASCPRHACRCAHGYCAKASFLSCFPETTAQLRRWHDAAVRRCPNSCCLERSWLLGFRSMA
jgi:hypothetical protein